MSVDIADWSLLTTVHNLAGNPDTPATETTIAEALDIPAHYAETVDATLPRRRRPRLRSPRSGE